MAKRQTRVLSSSIIEKWAEISGKKANIVMKNGAVLTAKLQQLRDDTLEIQNMRLSKDHLAIKEISEIIIDHY